MSEELKKYVNAYMDGEKVDYQFTDYAINDDWYRVGMFSDFDRKGVTFRIKPKEEDKWQRIKDEEYLCKFSGSHYGYSDAIDILKNYHPIQVAHRFEARETSAVYTNCEVLREKGHKQPFFQGDAIPEIDGAFITYYKDGLHHYSSGEYKSKIKWKEVIAYIEI